MPHAAAHVVPPERAARDLRAKYEEMRALRLLAAARTPHDPRPRMASLAARFPGALREIDALPLDAIEARLATLRRVEQGHCEQPRWVSVMHRFHALTRGVLFVKRATTTQPESSMGEWPAEALEWRDERARIASPPRGRLMDLVFERLGREVGVSPSAAKAMVFSVSVSVGG
jgi:hypothetical protein